MEFLATRVSAYVSGRGIKILATHQVKLAWHLKHSFQPNHGTSIVVVNIE